MSPRKILKIAIIASATVSSLISFIPSMAFSSQHSTGRENTFARVDSNEDGGDWGEGGDGEGDDGTHSPGRDCNGCHGFSLSGTVYADPQGRTPAAGATVTAQTSAGAITMVTDSLGNFYNGSHHNGRQGAPFYGPYSITITQGSNTAVMMAQPSYGGCNSTGCHDGVSVSRVYINSQTRGINSGTGNTGSAGNAGTRTGGTGTVNNINTSYNGRALYETLCRSCHETGASGAMPIVNVEGRGDNASITKNATATNRSRSGAATNMAAFGAALGWTDVKLQAIANYTYPSALAMPAPVAQNMFPVYANIETPVISANTENARPIGAGNLSSNILNWQIGLPAIPGPMDIIVAYQVGNGPLNYLNSSNRFVQNASAWKTVSNILINESITETLGVSGGNLQTSGLPAGMYTLWVAVMPAGNFTAGNLSAFYCWRTTFNK